MVFEGLYIEKSNGKGRGVFTKQTIPANTIIEISPVVVMSAEERTLLDQTLLHDYIFEWGKDQQAMLYGAWLCACVQSFLQIELRI